LLYQNPRAVATGQMRNLMKIPKLKVLYTEVAFLAGRYPSRF